MNRAIDRHEDAIVAVLGMVDLGIAYERALSAIARGQDMDPLRLAHLVRVWCAIANVSEPSGGPA